jgi:hypothetical protein
MLLGLLSSLIKRQLYIILCLYIVSLPVFSSILYTFVAHLNCLPCYKWQVHVVRCLNIVLLPLFSIILCIFLVHLHPLQEVDILLQERTSTTGPQSCRNDA